MTFSGWFETAGKTQTFGVKGDTPRDGAWALWHKWGDKAWGEDRECVDDSLDGDFWRQYDSICKSIEEIII